MGDLETYKYTFEGQFSEGIHSLLFSEAPEAKEGEFHESYQERLSMSGLACLLHSSLSNSIELQMSLVFIYALFFIMLG